MSCSELEDIQLLELLLEQNEEAFAEIYNRYWKILYTTAYNIVQNEELAKDAVQEVFIALWQRRNEANIRALQSYLRQSVRFQILKAIRAQKVNEQFYRRLAAITTDIFNDYPFLFKEHETLLSGIMNTLPDDCRQIFRLSREEQLTYRQIAGQLHISEKTVEKKISICLRHIRQALEQDKMLCMALLLLVNCRS